MASKVFGNHPFPPEEKRAIHIRGDLIHHFIYPVTTPHFSDLNYLYCSTDKLTVCTFQLGPGGVFEPPDYHTGDEVYLVLHGTLTEGNPPLGQFVQVREGEALLLPRPVWHKGYNFEQDYVRIFAVIAPRIWEDQLPPTDFTPKMNKLYKGVNNEGLTTYPPIPATHTTGTTDDIGRWPLPGPQSRQDPLLFYHIREEDKLINIHGTQYPMLIKFAVSNDLLHVGEFILPGGGISSRASEADVHRGDCLLYIDKGPITIYLPDTTEAFDVQESEAFFIPEGVRYQLINYTAGAVRAIFAIAPGL
jgi:mannose-6-phosphate isomerase-like protein (cupin superfamily)